MGVSLSMTVDEGGGAKGVLDGGGNTTRCELV